MIFVSDGSIPLSVVAFRPDAGRRWAKTGDTMETLETLLTGSLCGGDVAATLKSPSRLDLPKHSN